VRAQNPNIERQRRRIYVGGLPPNVNDNDVKQFFNETIRVKVPNVPPGDPITDTTLNVEKSFAFIELRTAAEATKTLALDGVVWMQRALKLRRPNDYVPPIEGEGNVEHIDGIVGTNVPDTPNKLFIGGLPTTLAEADVRELLATIGELKSFNLVRDTATNASKGFAFAEYIDDVTTERAIAALNSVCLMKLFAHVCVSVMLCFCVVAACRCRLATRRCSFSAHSSARAEATASRASGSCRLRTVSLTCCV
jgi:splicing factor U2AF subunit